MTESKTKDFRETVVARIRRDPVFRKALFDAAMEKLRSGDIAGYESLMRDLAAAGVNDSPTC